ncbi:hypothetical protein AGOR_G00087410 [Albula goreensis]|uniref:Uncharacterized protein n=1 Tax=Albula goreensis TaxID=1534307 RepID=A0A8T3DNT4_9TELE|nr:hypothetical protein AGOR_G00087410 [Albula goreensis]
MDHRAFCQQFGCCEQLNKNKRTREPESTRSSGLLPIVSGRPVATETELRESNKLHNNVVKWNEFWPSALNVASACKGVVTAGGSMRGAVAEGRLEVLQVCKLLQCVRERDKPQIEKLVRMGTPDLINMAEPQEGEGVLHLASAANDLDMAKFLLGQGARPDAQDRRGRTPVMRAAELGHDGMVTLLAQNRADMRLVDSEGRGILFYCISPTKRHRRCLQVALDSSADVNNVSAEGKPLLLLACELGQDCQSMCISILERGADPNAASKSTGRTALMEASKVGALELVRAILEKGGNGNALDKKRIHAAHLAAEGGFFEVIRVLSAYSANLGLVAADGNTPLHHAARGGFADCCRFIAQRGCNPKIKNQEGLIPRQIAKEGGHKAVVKELRKAERLHGKYSRQEPKTPTSSGL